MRKVKARWQKLTSNIIYCMKVVNSFNINNSSQVIAVFLTDCITKLVMSVHKTIVPKLMVQSAVPGISLRRGYLFRSAIYTRGISKV